MKRKEIPLAEKMANRDIVLYVEGNRRRNEIIERLESYDNIDTDEIIEPATSLSSFKALAVGIGPIVIDHETFLININESERLNQFVSAINADKEIILPRSAMETQKAYILIYGEKPGSAVFDKIKRDILDLKRHNIPLNLEIIDEIGFMALIRQEAGALKEREELKKHDIHAKMSVLRHEKKTQKRKNVGMDTIQQNKSLVA